MKLKAVVPFLGERAYYEVIPEAPDIYQARLIKYEGSDGVTPPQSITLVRSVRRWAGSYDERYFVDALGEAIDERVREGNPHAR